MAAALVMLRNSPAMPTTRSHNCLQATQPSTPREGKVTGGPGFSTPVNNMTATQTPAQCINHNTALHHADTQNRVQGAQAPQNTQNTAMTLTDGAQTAPQQQKPQTHTTGSRQSRTKSVQESVVARSDATTVEMAHSSRSQITPSAGQKEGCEFKKRKLNPGP